MTSPIPAEETPAADSGGVLERIGTQLAALTAQVSQIDDRMTSVESGAPPQPVEVQLSPETVAQIADALAGLQAAGSQALDDAFKSASDDLTEALSGLVQAEVSRTLADAGYTVEVIEAAEPDVEVAPYEPAAQDVHPDPYESAALPSADAPVVAAPVEAAVPVEGLLPAEPVADGPETASAAIPPLAVSVAEPVGEAAFEPEPAAAPAIQDAGEEADDEDSGADGDVERLPLSLEELDDPFLDALIRKEPLSA